MQIARDNLLFGIGMHTWDFIRWDYGILEPFRLDPHNSYLLLIAEFGLPVGLLLITGMLIIPAAMARNISDSPLKMVLFSIIGGLLSVIIGLFSSLEFNTPSGPSIIAASLLLFILSLLKIKQTVQLKN